MNKVCIAAVVVMAGAATARADHQVVANGSVLFSNVTTGPLAGVAAGTPVQLWFVVDQTPTVLVPDQVSEYALNFVETRVTVGAQAFHFSTTPTTPVLMFQNDNDLDSGSDGMETIPDVVGLEGTPYQMRFHAHNIEGNMFTSSDMAQCAGSYSGSQIHHMTWTIYNGIQGVLMQLGTFNVMPGAACDSVDFNTDGLFPDTQDIADFLTVFGGGACPTGTCGDIDFNNDGLFPDTEDIAAMLRVFAGGPCAV
jgi:hypothetical protein